MDIIKGVSGFLLFACFLVSNFATDIFNLTNRQALVYQIESQPKEDKFNPIDTSRTFIQPPCLEENKWILYCPSYLRIWIINIHNIDIANLSAEIELEIRIDVDVTGLPKKLKRHI